MWAAKWEKKRNKIIEGDGKTLPELESKWHAFTELAFGKKVTPVKGPYENTYISRLILDTECMYACVDV